MVYDEYHSSQHALRNIVVFLGGGGGEGVSEFVTYKIK